MRRTRWTGLLLGGAAVVLLRAIARLRSSPPAPPVPPPAPAPSPEPDRQFSWGRMTAGVVLLVSSMCIALMTYYVKPSPTSFGPNDVASDVGLSIGGAHFGHWAGFSAAAVVRPATRLSGCNPVEVVTAFVATPQFWRRNAAGLPRSVPFAIGIWGEEVEDVRVRLLRTADGANLQYLESSLIFRDGALDESRAPRRALRMHRPRVRDWGYVARGEIEGWSRTWAPIVVSYKARLASARGVGSCFVHPPSLTGGQPALTRLAARYRPAGARFHTPVVAGSSLLSLDEATPVGAVERLAGPYDDSSQIVRCAALSFLPPRPLTLVSPTGAVRAVAPEWRARDSGSCNDPLAIEVHNASTVRSVVLFLLGALIALAMQMIYEAATLSRARGALTVGAVLRAVVAGAVVLAMVLLYPDTAFPFETDPSPALALVGLVAGLLAGRWWLALVPWATLPGLLLYALHFSAAAKSGWALDTGTTAEVLGSYALLTTAAISVGVVLRRRDLPRVARRLLGPPRQRQRASD